MENIIIKNIEKKDSGLVIVGYNGNKEATLNTKWQSQEVDYLEKDVGIGGSVDVLIVQKGDYTNITKVGFESAKPNTTITESEKIVDQEVNTGSGLMSVKDIQIISQCLVKAWVQTDKSPQEILDAYHFFVKSLEEYG